MTRIELSTCFALLMVGCAPRTSPQPKASTDATQVNAPTPVHPDASAPAPSDPCDAITAADVAELCGAEVELVVDPDEGLPDQPLCRRTVGTAGSQRFSFTLWRTDPDDTRRRFAESVPTARDRVKVTEVAIGDEAVLVVDARAKASRDFALLVRLRSDYLAIRFHKGGTPKLACQRHLPELARRALERLE